MPYHDHRLGYDDGAILDHEMITKRVTTIKRATGHISLATENTVMFRSSIFTPLVLAFFCLIAGTGRCGAQTTDPSKAEEIKPDGPTGKRRSLTEPLEKIATPVDDYVTPDMVAAKAFGPPPEAKQLTKSHLWIDRKKSRVYFDGYVAMRDGPLEMFACPMGTKEHESVIGTLPKASEVHAALLAINAIPGAPVSFLPKFVPASGQRIRVWVCWRDQEGKFHVIDGRKWVQKSGTKESMNSEWVFAGSGFWEDPSDGHKYYRADSGDMICVSNFSTAMLDVNIASSAESDQLQFSPFTERIPERFTPVRVVLVPIPDADGKAKSESDRKDSGPSQVDPNEPPTEAVLPKRSGS